MKNKKNILFFFLLTSLLVSQTSYSMQNEDEDDKDPKHFFTRKGLGNPEDAKKYSEILRLKADIIEDEVRIEKAMHQSNEIKRKESDSTWISTSVRLETIARASVAVSTTVAAGFAAKKLYDYVTSESPEKEKGTSIEDKKFPEGCIVETAKQDGDSTEKKITEVL